MAFAGLHASLKRGVGRRIFSLFLLAGIFPVLFTASLAYFEVGRSTSEDVQKTLHANARQYGFELLNRLQQAAAAAEDSVWAEMNVQNEGYIQTMKDEGMKVEPPSDELQAELSAIGEQMTEEWIETAGDVGAKIIAAYRAA